MAAAVAADADVELDVAVGLGAAEAAVGEPSLRLRCAATEGLPVAGRRVFFGWAY